MGYHFSNDASDIVFGDAFGLTKLSSPKKVKTVSKYAFDPQAQMSGTADRVMVDGSYFERSMGGFTNYQVLAERKTLKVERGSREEDLRMMEGPVWVRAFIGGVSTVDPIIDSRPKGKEVLRVSEHQPSGKLDFGVWQRPLEDLRPTVCFSLSRDGKSFACLRREYVPRLHASEHPQAAEGWLMLESIRDASTDDSDHRVAQDSLAPATGSRASCELFAGCPSRLAADTHVGFANTH